MGFENDLGFEALCRLRNEKDSTIFLYSKMELWKRKGQCHSSILGLDANLDSQHKLRIEKL